MRRVIGDTGPINYLILIGHIDILPALFEMVIMPVAVQGELTREKAPPAVRSWIARPPAWLDVRKTPSQPFDDDSLGGLDEGEREAILLATSLHFDALLLMDDRAGVRAARRKGLAVTGTIGILEAAALQGLLDLPEAFARLRRTTFRYPEDLLQRVLAQINEGKP